MSADDFSMQLECINSAGLQAHSPVDFCIRTETKLLISGSLLMSYARLISNTDVSYGSFRAADCRPAAIANNQQLSVQKFMKSQRKRDWTSDPLTQG